MGEVAWGGRRIFEAWVWEPSHVGLHRGGPTADLLVETGRIVVTAKKRFLGIGANVFGVVEYTWPTAIVERLKPMLHSDLLIDIRGELGSV